MTSFNKRKVLTADDLSRSLEDPRKRTKHTHIDDSSDAESASDASVEEDEQQEEPEEDEEDGEDEDSDSEVELGSSTPHFEVEDRFGFSKTKDKPNERTSAKKTDVSSFSSLGISPALQATLSSMSIRLPTEVQAACIPPLMSGKFYVI